MFRDGAPTPIWIGAFLIPINTLLPGMCYHINSVVLGQRFGLLPVVKVRALGV